MTFHYRLRNTETAQKSNSLYEIEYIISIITSDRGLEKSDTTTTFKPLNIHLTLATQDSYATFIHVAQM